MAIGGGKQTNPFQKRTGFSRLVPGGAGKDAASQRIIREKQALNPKTMRKQARRAAAGRELRRRKLWGVTAKGLYGAAAATALYGTYKAFSKKKKKKKAPLVNPVMGI